jgi:hypothetical protein
MRGDEFQPSTVPHHLVAGPGFHKVATPALRVCSRGGFRLDLPSRIGYGPPEVMEWRAAAVAGGPGHAGLPLPAAAEAHRRQERGDLAGRALLAP